MKLAEVSLETLHMVSAEQAFEWVKSSVWNKKDFLKWVEAIEEHKESLGWKRGFFNED